MPVEPYLDVHILVREMASKAIVKSVLVVYGGPVSPCFFQAYMIKY